LRRRYTRRFHLRLAMRFHRPDVDAFLAELTAGELAEWEAFYALEPWGELRADQRFAKVVAAIFNTAFGRTKDTPTMKPSDVFDTLAPDPLETQTPAQMRAAIGGGRTGRGRKGA
jgi:hypothetical protein